MKRAALFILLALAASCSKDPIVEREKYFASAEKYLEAEKYEEATIEFRNALRLDGEHIPSYLGIAKAFQGMGDHQNAIGSFQQVVKMDNTNVEAKLRIAEYQFAGGTRDPELLELAQETIEEVLEVEPANIEALILCANVYARQDEIEKAMDAINKALSIDPQNLRATLSLAAAYFQKDEIDNAEATYNEAINDHPEAAEPHLAIAALYASIKQPKKIELHLKKAFELAPTDPRCLSSLAGYYISSENLAEAENVFLEAIAQNPKAREPRWELSGFYRNQGDSKKEMITLQDMLEVDPRDQQSQLRMVELYLQQKEFDRAEENIRSVLTENKNSAEGHYLQGILMNAKNENDSALAEFQKSIELNPAMPAPYLEKAKLLVSHGDLEGAQSTLETALQHDRGNLLAQGALAKILSQRQRSQDALQLAQEVLSAMPGNEDALAARGEAFRVLGNLEEAKKDFLRLSELQPQVSHYWHRLGIIEAMQGNAEPALALFRKAVELQPDLTVAINDIVYLLLQEKQYDAALSELDRLSGSDSPLDEIQRFRGQVFLSKGDVSSGERALRKAIEINPQNYQAYIMLGQLNLQQNNISQAIREVDQLIAQNDRLAPAYLLKAYYLQVANDSRGATTNYRKVLELDPENPVAANNLAWLLCESNANIDNALSLAKIAKKRAPEDPEVADTLGWIYYKMKSYTLSVNQLLLSVNNRKQPKAEHYYRLGMAYYAKGDRILAKQTLTKSLKLSSSFAGADEARKLLKELG